MLIRVIYQLNKKRLYEINEKKNKKKNAFIKRFLKSKCWYWLIVKQKLLNTKNTFLTIYFPIFITRLAFKLFYFLYLKT